MPPTRTELRDATRTRVRDAADRLFTEHGFESTTIRDIARESDVSVGTVMACGDKDALLVQVFDALIERGHAPGLARVEPRAGTCADRITELVRPFVQLFTRRLDLAHVYASILVSGKHSSIVFEGLASLLVDEVRGVITEHGCAAADDATGVAQAVHVAYLGTLFSSASWPAVDEESLSASLHGTFAAICRCSA